MKYFYERFVATALFTYVSNDTFFILEQVVSTLNKSPPTVLFQVNFDCFLSLISKSLDIFSGVFLSWNRLYRH
jgi:hypothetical protein